MRYAIFEKEINREYMRLMHRVCLRMAEDALKFNLDTHYERAVQRGDGLYLYTYEDAQAIVNYWEQRYAPYAKLTLIGDPSTL